MTFSLRTNEHILPLNYTYSTYLIASAAGLYRSTSSLARSQMIIFRLAQLQKHVFPCSTSHEVSAK